MTTDPQATLARALRGLTVLERGWLSSNNVLIHPAQGEAGAVLVDTAHLVHAAQTLALVRHALAGQPLARIVNTHLHSDHCGGNAALQREHGAPIVIPPGLASAVRAWDLARLSHDDFGLRERFFIEGTLAPGEHFTAGARQWQALAAPGHDPHSLMLFDEAAGLLLSADALWENGFGVVFPELVGEEGGFAGVAATLERIESLRAEVVVPGHGAPFTDVAGALARARSRLEGFRADPRRHARHAAKVLLKYHVMEEQRVPHAELVRWSAAAPLMREVWQRFGPPPGPAGGLERWIEGFVAELVTAGVLALEGEVVVDR
ncbi:MAG: MBL fold metallo-hydrolase [Rubrivivax sp.]|nr:MBL fold metallo-hydrolase [Rubrivivax sp.]